jgi:hypothetical protein
VVVSLCPFGHPRASVPPRLGSSAPRAANRCSAMLAHVLLWLSLLGSVRVTAPQRLCRKKAPHCPLLHTEQVNASRATGPIYGVRRLRTACPRFFSCIVASVVQHTFSRGALVIVRTTAGGAMGSRVNVANIWIAF